MGKKNKTVPVKMQRVLRFEIRLDDPIFQSGASATQYINSLFDSAKENYVRALADLSNSVLVHPVVNGISYNNMANLRVANSDVSLWKSNT